jgi:hypothetical protein
MANVCPDLTSGQVGNNAEPGNVRSACMPGAPEVQLDELLEEEAVDNNLLMVSTDAAEKPAILQHYRACKLVDSGLSAFFVLPSLPAAPWLPLLRVAVVCLYASPAVFDAGLAHRHRRHSLKPSSTVRGLTVVQVRKFTLQQRATHGQNAATAHPGRTTRTVLALRRVAGRVLLRRLRRRTVARALQAATRDV